MVQLIHRSKRKIEKGMEKILYRLLKNNTNMSIGQNLNTLQIFDFLNRKWVQNVAKNI